MDEQDKRIVEKGKLWKEFANTLWGQDLYAFFEREEQDCKDKVYEQACKGEDEVFYESKRLEGVLAVKEYITNCIEDMTQIINENEEDKQMRREIPKHV